MGYFLKGIKRYCGLLVYIAAVLLPLTVIDWGDLKGNSESWDLAS